MQSRKWRCCCSSLIVRESGWTEKSRSFLKEKELFRGNTILEWTALEKVIGIARENGLQDALALAELKRVSLAMDTVNQVARRAEQFE